MEVTPVIITHPELQGTAPSIWGSVECDAWSRDCNYEQYVEWHGLCKCRGKVMREAEYLALCKVFETCFENDMQ
jgi:hypothetical protein